MVRTRSAAELTGGRNSVSPPVRSERRKRPSERVQAEPLVSLEEFDAMKRKNEEATTTLRAMVSFFREALPQFSLPYEVQQLVGESTPRQTYERGQPSGLVNAGQDAGMPYNATVDPARQSSPSAPRRQSSPVAQARQSSPSAPRRQSSSEAHRRYDSPASPMRQTSPLSYER